MELSDSSITCREGNKVGGEAQISDLAVLQQTISQHKRVIFNGDGYTAEWHKEAERRGLPNLKNTVDALPVIIRKDTIDLLTRYKVYSERELHSRLAILLLGAPAVQSELYSTRYNKWTAAAREALFETLRYTLDVGRSAGRWEIGAIETRASD